MNYVISHEKNTVRDVKGKYSRTMERILKKEIRKVTFELATEGKNRI